MGGIQGHFSGAKLQILGMLTILKIDRGSQRGAVHSGTSIYNNDRCNGILYIFG